MLVLVTFVVLLSSTTPSIMYSGSDDPEIVLGPRSLTENPPAGSPEFCVICAPAILPCRPLKRLWGVALVNSSDFTVEIALPSSFRVEVTDEPITTISSKPRMSCLSTMLNEVLP